MSTPNIALVLPLMGLEHLYWTQEDWRLGCKIHHPAHTIAFTYAIGVTNFYEDTNVKPFLDEHRNCAKNENENEA